MTFPEVSAQDMYRWLHFDGLVSDCSNSNAWAMELPQFSAELSICNCRGAFQKRVRALKSKSS